MAEGEANSTARRAQKFDGVNSVVTDA